MIGDKNDPNIRAFRSKGAAQSALDRMAEKYKNLVDCKVIESNF